MQQNIKIAVIGGTGKAGKYLVKQLVKKGFHLKLLLRTPEKFQLEESIHIKPSLIELIKGDARYYESVNSLISGCDAVISTIGQPIGEPTIFSQATINVIKAMEEHHIKRYIVTTGLNVDTLLDHKSPNVVAATEWMRVNYPLTTADKQLELDILSASDIDWTLVRLPLIRQTDENLAVKVSLEDCPGEYISATDLALFIIDQLFDNQYIRKSPFIANV